MEVVTSAPQEGALLDSPPIFITDAELSKRWHCSVMKIWRMRQDGRLNPGIKPGGGGPNLNLPITYLGSRG